MKYLADENIPLKVIRALVGRGVSLSSLSTNMRGKSDLEIIQYASKHDLIIITFDKDFGHLVYKEEIMSKGVILLRFSPKSSEMILKILEKLLLSTSFNPIGKFVVVYENHFRIVDLPKNKK